jgi:hypothetical protein
MKSLRLKAYLFYAANIIAFIAIALDAFAQQPAFPTAEGVGRFTTGGRGTPSTPTTVYEVTNLNDDNLPGSFRYALTNNSPAATYRTIVFRISGTIHLTSALSISRANTTIAGQTAPGDGICLADYPVTLSADNVIVRYLRFRMGDKNQNTGMVNGAGADDAFGGTGHKNIIVDHCTMSWSTDEACSIYRGDSTTIQWSMISEPLNYSYHYETGDTGYEHHGYGGIWGGRHASFHHNLLAHCQGRVPRFDGSRNLPNSTTPVVGSENADFRNNLLYNWGIYNTNGGEGGNYNIVNNYYKFGPSTSTGSNAGVSIKYMIINPYKQTSPALPYGKYFVDGNYVDGNATITSDNWRGAAMSGGSLADTSQSKVDTPFDLGSVTTQNAVDVYELVLQNAGCTKPNRDTLDQRIVNDVRNRTGRLIDVQGGYPHGTPYNQTVNAWPTLNSTTPPVDTDHDGMPDTWETNHGSNPNDATDRNIIDSNGYTKLENYLNSLASENTLPLTLTSFSASYVNNTVNLAWSTTNEINTSHFDVERGDNATGFAIIGTVTSLNSINANSYSFKDGKPVNGIAYYRLKMVDRDGAFKYSKVVVINNAIQNKLSVYPNPGNNNVTVSHANASANATLDVVSIDGKRVLSVKLQQNATQTSVDVSALKAGTYTIAFRNGSEKFSVEFVKQ